MQRRHFLRSAAAIAALMALREEAIAAPEGIPRRTLGRTGQSVSIIGIGGAHIGGSRISEQDAIRIVRTALDAGVNFLDNCWDYNDGDSERRMGLALQNGYRQKAFLMTKIDGRTPVAAQKQIEDSLRRLKTDRIDLMQIHEVIRPGDPEQAFRPGYVVDVLKQAQKDGKIRYIGFTGHKSPEIHLSMLETADRHGFTFDTVQMPLNLMDAHYDSFTTKVLPVARRHNMGILGMKPMGSGVLLRSDTATPVEFLHYAMSLPVSVTITGCDSMQVLDQALTLARNFRPLPHDAITALLAKTANAAVAGEYEKYKTSHMFDGTVHNPQYLG